MTLAWQQMQAQFGVFAFLKRAIILHSSKLVALLLFAAAAQGKCAVGWLLIGEAPAECTMAADVRPQGCSILIKSVECSWIGRRRAAAGWTQILDTSPTEAAACKPDRCRLPSRLLDGRAVRLPGTTSMLPSGCIQTDSRLQAPSQNSIKPLTGMKHTP